MGITAWRSASFSVFEATPLSAFKQVSFAAAASLLNPHAILDTLGVIGTNALQFAGSERFAYILACLSVSFCWFFGLAVTGFYLKKLDNHGQAVKVTTEYQHNYVVWHSICFASL